MTPKTILELQELAFQGRVSFNNGHGYYVAADGPHLAYLNGLPPNDPIFAWYRDWEYKILPEPNDADNTDSNSGEEPEFGGGERSSGSLLYNVELSRDECAFIRAAVNDYYGPYSTIPVVKNLLEKLELN